MTSTASAQPTQDAPVAPGTYQGFWNMRNAANAKFGETVWVGITVVLRALGMVR